jgi:hypothetical protein
VFFLAAAAHARYCSEPCRPARRRHYPKRPTAERGYDNAHQKRRRELLPKAYGKPCELCGVVMLKDDKLDLDHSTPLALGGKKGDRIVHAFCNRSAGARLGRQIRLGHVQRAGDVATEHPSLLLDSTEL